MSCTLLQISCSTTTLICNATHRGLLPAKIIQLWMLQRRQNIFQLYTNIQEDVYIRATHLHSCLHFSEITAAWLGAKHFLPLRFEYLLLRRHNYKWISNGITESSLQKSVKNQAFVRHLSNSYNRIQKSCDNWSCKSNILLMHIWHFGKSNITDVMILKLTFVQLV